MRQDKIILDIFVSESFEILSRNLIHIIGTLSIATAMLFTDGGLPLMSQKLEIPSRWRTDFLNVPPLYKNDTIVLRFLGDVMMHQRQIESAYRGDGTYDFSSYFEYIKDDLKQADIAIANMEFALGGEPYTGYPSFSAPDAIAEYMAECGVDIFLTANNHIYDKGRIGVERTLGIYRSLKDSEGTSFTGTASDIEEREDNHPLIETVNGIRLAFINMTYTTNGGKREGWPKVNYLYEEEEVEIAFIRAEEKQADIVIALPHWGEEYELLPSVQQEETALDMIGKGADLIIGAHPHVVQSIEEVAGVQIAYSLGNAVSNMSARNTRVELMITARIVREANGNVKVLELEPKFLWCSLPWQFSAEYTVLPIKDFIGKRELWMNKADYDNMVETYKRVKSITGIED